MKPYEQTDLYKFGMIKDRRRRIVLPIPNTDTGYHIHERDMKQIGLINGEAMWVMLAFVLMIGILNRPLWECALVPALVLAAFEGYKHFVFYKKQAVLKITESDLAILDSVDALTAKRSDARVETIFGALLVFVILLRFVETGGFKGADMVVGTLMISAAAGYIAHSVIKWSRTSKQIRKLKKESNETK